jgi:threonyl-tRNA synthetase
MSEQSPHDHRAVGARQDLFHFSPDAPGMAFWHPRGVAIYQALEAAVRARQRAERFVEVRTPQIVRRPVWERSGHWDCFRENLFVAGDPDHALVEVVKPVSCPGHLDIARHRSLSYRDLPFRIAELGLVHRDEPSGALHGLFRLRQFTQDDGHILCAEEHVADEVARFVASLRRFYRAVGFERIGVAFSSAPKVRAGSDAVWAEAEGLLRRAAEAAMLELEEQPGEGAFYGPKLELVLEDRMGRRWQMGTIQLDLVLPERFDVHYVDARGERRRPIVLHRAMLGSLERFVGILLEHHAGALPAWLAPEQVRLATVHPNARELARELEARLEPLRVHVDDRDESLGRKVRDAHELGVPFVVVLGAREVERREVAIRSRDGQRALPIEHALAALRDACRPPPV